MSHAGETLDALEVPYEMRVISAHRRPDATVEWARGAKGRGLKVLIAGAGLAARLPGVISACSTLPVLGVPMPGSSLGAADALYSIVQMPRGVPVGTLAIGKSGAVNAALLAAEIIALNDEALSDRLEVYRQRLRDDVTNDDAALQAALEGRTEGESLSEALLKAGLTKG